ncbi:MAG TPA: ABC transporter permease [Gemmatimonadaceae bacterium]|nr:ABC transporter permease [Gemmatimonadaceae bacterium]
MPDLRYLLPTSELRFAARRIRRAPSFAAAVVLVLALGVGATTTVFSLVNGIVLEPLPYPESSRLVRLTHTVSNTAVATVDQSDATVLLYQSRTRAFEGVAAWRFDDGDLGASEAGQAAVRVRGARVTANFFDVLGVHPALGRSFAPGEDRPGRNGVVVLSHRIWEERFHGDPDAIGRQILVNEVPRTIVGIMPQRFAYPASQVELWLPLSLDPARTHPATFNLIGVALLAPGVSTEAARADLARVLPNVVDYFHGDASPETWRQAHVVPRVQSLRDSIVGPVSHLVWLVFGSALLVLLVACTNVAGLFLVRAERGQTELAVRGALGSGFMGMIAPTLSESVLLSAVGGGAGVLLAAATMKAARVAGAALSLPRLENVGVDAPVLLFALGATMFCALSVNVLPLLRARRSSLAQLVRGAGAGSTGGRPHQRARDALVVAQIALALVLVACSGLMTRSFLLLNDVQPGFDADRVVTSRVLLPYASYGGADARLNFFVGLERQARAIPGARDVALTDRVPLSGDHQSMALDVEDDSSRAHAGGADHAVASVGDRYFRTLHIPLLRGQTFGIPDAEHPSDQVIVSRAFAERYWPGASPIGKRLRPLGGRWYTVIGEVGDVHYEALDQPASEIVYFPIVTTARDGADATLPAALSLVVRTDAGEGETLTAIRGIVRALDTNVPTYNEGSLRELVHDASARTRAFVALLAVASISTLLLGAVGLYGITAYSVSVRRRELGIRMALGARPADVSRMVSLHGLRLAGVGIVIGMACTLATARLLHGLLYGVSPTDPVTLGVTPLVLLAVAFVASWIAARRAAAVEPAEALRSQ